MNRSGTPAVCLAVCWVPSISSSQLSIEPPSQTRKHKGWGWELMERGGRAGEADLLLLILGWHTGVEANSTSTKASQQAGPWSVHLSSGHLLLNGEQDL